ncbi:hypothetical protein HDU91_007242 [Kappamyces sp. JEL0680]|nr:hypothetical protein HDU91_007242 [Kappamyces sp. JEL0680]
MSQLDKRKLAFDVSLLVLSQVALYFGVKYILNSLDPHAKKRQESKAKSGRIMEKMGLKNMELNEHEQIIASEILWPEDLKDILDSLKETVIYPLVYPEVFESVSGVLLYGPPGCGKTMTAKALAKESGATFINLHVSTMTDKWFGESQKLVHALFSLARKLQPTIIFIDEIDSFLRER